MTRMDTIYNKHDISLEKPPLDHIHTLRTLELLFFFNHKFSAAFAPLVHMQMEVLQRKHF